MATWDETELANAVLTRLGVKAAGDTAPAEDVAVVTAAWTSIYKQLRRHKLAPWASDAIEEAYQEPLAKFVAGEIYGNYGFTGAREQTILRDAANGWRQLQEQVAADKTTAPIRPKYF